MNSLKRWIIIIALLVIALACYGIGFVKGAGVFLALGVLFELAFWFGLFEKVTNNSTSS